MARSPFLTAYLATVSPPERGMVGPETPPRPKGAVVWAICSDPEQLAAIHRLAERLADDGEIITVIPTLPIPQDPHIQISPNTKRTARAFLAHWRPEIVMWVGGPLNAAPLIEIQNSGAAVFLVEADSREIDKTSGRRVPGLLRSLLSDFDEVLTVDIGTATRLVKAGANMARTQTTGPLEDGVVPPTYKEFERAALSEMLGFRPMWFAADVPLGELPVVAKAHRYAARRAHRNLLILAPRELTDGPEMVQTLRADGYSVAHQSDGDQPKESTQIFVVDKVHALGLWSRLAPITYLGGSLSDGQTCDAFAPATVGSAVLAGSKINTLKSHYSRLLAAQALQPVDNEDDLGRCVEHLLATDLVAQIAHNAWDVTSRGADTTNILVALIYKYLDEVDF